MPSFETLLFVQCHQVLGRLVADDQRLLEHHPDGISAALLVAPGARMVDQDVPHDPRRYGKKVSAVPPRDVLRIDEPQVRLIDQCRRLQAVARVLVPHVLSRDSMEFVVDERQQLLECARVSFTPLEQETGHVGRIHR